MDLVTENPTVNLFLFKYVDSVWSLPFLLFCSSLKIVSRMCQPLLLYSSVETVHNYCMVYYDWLAEYKSGL